MPVKVDKAFKWSPRGYDVILVNPGDQELGPRAVAAGIAQGAIAEDQEPSLNTDKCDVQEIENEQREQQRLDHIDRLREELNEAKQRIAELEKELALPKQIAESARIAELEAELAKTRKALSGQGKSEQKEPEQKEPEQKDPEQKDPEQKDPEQKDPEQKDPEQKAPAKSSSTKKK